MDGVLIWQRACNVKPKGINSSHNNLTIPTYDVSYYIFNIFFYLTRQLLLTTRLLLSYIFLSILSISKVMNNMSTNSVLMKTHFPFVFLHFLKPRHLIQRSKNLHLKPFFSLQNSFFVFLVWLINIQLCLKMIYNHKYRR